MLACAAMSLFRAALALVLVTGSAAAGCMAVPDLTFAEEDAAVPGVATLAGDASVLDAGDAEPADGGAAAAARGEKSHKTCPDAAPSNVDRCCGRVRCVGAGCSPSQCDSCKRCAATSVCCVPKVGAPARCAPNVAACR